MFRSCHQAVLKLYYQYRIAIEQIRLMPHLRDKNPSADPWNTGQIIPADPVIPMCISRPARYSLVIKIHNSDNIIAAYKFMFETLKITWTHMTLTPNN